MGFDQNLVALTGRLTRDPESRAIQSGKSVCKWTLAVGTGKDSTAFVDCEAWERTAELVQQHVNKGDALTVHGSLVQQNWDDKDTGAKRSKLLVRVDRIYFPPQNRTSGEKRHGSGGQPRSTGANRPDDWPPVDDEAPF